MLLLTVNTNELVETILCCIFVIVRYSVNMCDLCFPVRGRAWVRTKIIFPAEVHNEIAHQYYPR